MNILIRQARVVAPHNTNNRKVVDILIEGGAITSIKKNITAKAGVRVIEGRDLCVSAGWVDMQAISCDPGFEHRETLDTLVKCAAAGGFTAVCIHNHNQPALHNKTQIEYIINKTGNRIVDVYPLGTITVGGKGEDLAEMYDMQQSGAVGFSDYKHPIKDAGMMLRALQYSDNIGALIVAHANDQYLSRGGQVNEGETATTLGLKGIPAIAEELMLQRNITLLEYGGGRLHVPTISTRGSIELVKKAKSAGLAVTCGVAAANLLLDDSSLGDFDTNFKLDPPLRSKKDVLALRNALNNGTIDVVVSDHAPYDTESKELEFDLADFGMISLQTAFSCAFQAVQKDGLDNLITALTSRPREILSLPAVSIAEGETANLTIFSTSEKTKLTDKTNESLSRNSPFYDKVLDGKVIGIVNGAKSFFNV